MQLKKNQEIKVMDYNNLNVKLKPLKIKIKIK